jgi:hypothetical protein
MVRKARCDFLLTRYIPIQVSVTLYKQLCIPHGPIRVVALFQGFWLSRVKALSFVRIFGSAVPCVGRLLEDLTILIILVCFTGHVPTTELRIYPEIPLLF